VFCKYFNNSPEQNNINNQNYTQLDVFLNKPDLKNITHIIHYNTPAYFIYKINEINLIIGQQQLELCRQLLHIYEGQNKLFKLEQHNQKNVQKCIDWCVKMNIPYYDINTNFETDAHNYLSIS